MKIISALTALLVTAALAAHAADHAPYWGYRGEHGPAKWGDMEAGFSQCKLGKEQSPVDIRNAKKSALPALDFNYKQSNAEAINNGHTIQVSLADGGVLNLDGVLYKLVQFHFHTPSEEKIDGKARAMVAHLVHQNAGGKLAVVAVLLTEGKANAALAPVFDGMPQAEGSKKALASGLNAADFLPAE